MLPRSRRGRLAALACCGLACLATAVAVAAVRPVPDQSRMLLRLGDLPLGYLNFELQEEQGDEVFCSPLTHPDDTPPRMARFILRYHPRGCIGAYGRLYSLPGEEPGPLATGTGVLALGSDRAADAGWAVVPEILGRLLGDRPPKEVEAKERVGRATRLFHARFKDQASGTRSHLGSVTSFLVWRSGNTLAVIEVFGTEVAANDRVAAALARLQQARIERSGRYTRSERFDGEVPLDDPALDLPVYWLGRNFRPGGGLPDNRLFDSGFSGRASEETVRPFREGPGSPLFIRYENIRLATWTPATWGVFARSETAAAITSWRCTKTRVVALPGGEATIFGGYRRDFARCPKEAPQAFTAWVDVAGVKIVVNGPPAPDFIETVNPYGSFEGMEAIVRGLTPRPRSY
jgi:hypothetical protein